MAPTEILPDGTQIWRDHEGEYHRDDGPAYIRGQMMGYFRHGAYHRDDGPAYIGQDGELRYYQSGKAHRLNGPAVLAPNGDVEYWVNGEIPTFVDDMLITQDDVGIYPSARLVPEVRYFGRWDNYHAYHLDPTDLALAILRYG